MNRNAIGAAFIAAGCLVSGAAMAGAPGVRISDVETALSVTGWDIVHTAEGADGSRVIGARSHSGWPVIHTLSACEADICAVWTQSVPLETGLMEAPVNYKASSHLLAPRMGSTLIAESSDSGQVVLRGSIMGNDCASDCQMQAIESFASAAEVSYRALSSNAATAAAHTGFGGWSIVDAEEQDQPAAMDHRQIAAIVSATEDEADRLRIRFTAPRVTHTLAEPTIGTAGTISFPPLLPE